MKKRKARVSGYGQSYVVRVPDDLLEMFLEKAKREGFCGSELVRAFMGAYVSGCYVEKK